MKEVIFKKTAIFWIKSIFKRLDTSLATCLLLTMAVSINTAKAENSVSNATKLIETYVSDNTAISELESVSKVQANKVSSSLAPLEYSGIAPELDVNLGEEVVFSQKHEIPKPKKSHLTAQVDSSGTVGDTFGETNKLRQELLIEPIVVPGPSGVVPAPGSSAGTPTAYGASLGQAYIGGGIFFPLEDADRVDGSLGVGFGLGDSVKSVGLEVNANVTSVTPEGDDFADSGTLGLKLHKFFKDGTAVAIGWSNIIKWGDSSNGADTIYGVVTKSFDLQPNNPNNKLPLTVSAGIGSGSFRSKGAIQDGNNTPNVFGSVGLRVAQPVSLVSSWTGNRLNLGASVAPFPKIPLVFNAIFTDVTSNFSSGTGFTLSAGYSIQF